MARRLRVLAALGAAVVMLFAAIAEAKPKLRTGFADFAFPGISQRWMEETRALSGDIVRINAYWRDIALERPARPTDPADRAYAWGTLDAIVRGAVSRGLDPMITAFNSPRWAQGPDRPGNAAFETWRPDTESFGQFAQALAARYSGRFDPDGAGSELPLPKVRYLQAWNEPNLAFFLAPQWGGDASSSPPPSPPPTNPPPPSPSPLPPLPPLPRADDPNDDPKSPAIYRGLLNAFYDGAKAGNPDVRVVAAGAAPIGDPPGGERMRPLAFWRDVFCLTGRKELSTTSCPEKARFDIFAHHPISLAGDPRVGAVHPDDAFAADFHKVIRLLRAAENRGTVASPKKHPVWATEFWIESNPPDRPGGAPLKTQARWIQQSLYMFWRQGAEVALYFQIADSPYDPADPKKNLQSGAFFDDWRAKPAATAFRFPFVAANASRKKVKAWGVAPGKGTVRIQQRAKGGWKTIARVRKAKRNEVFTKRLRRDGGAKLRATQRSVRSLGWRN